MKSQRIIFFLIALTSLLYSNNGTATAYFEPLRYDEANGGYVIRESKFRAIDYKTNERDKELQKKPTNPYVAYWKVGRNSLGMKPDYSKCGEEPKYPDDLEYKTWGERERLPKYINYKKTRTEYEECTSNITQTFDSQIKYKYYYARMPESHLINYPKKSDLHYRWNDSLFIGGVNDLAIEAIPDEYKNNLEQLRSHKCHKWGAKVNHTCYDLPNGDKNIYYAIREELYIKDEDGKQKPNRYLMDVRVSEPLNWIEINGIEIDKEIYEYIDKTCKDPFFCHLNNYTGALSQEQKDYVKKVKWNKDEVWKEEKKKESKGSSNPWR
ncbi:MAG: hypothetical protein KBF12_14290 [Sebaldella sp.]|nr:hypothetical protein [Sebaldella sp.]